MRSPRGLGTDQAPERRRTDGKASPAMLVLLLMLALVAGLSPPAARMVERSASTPAAPRTQAVPLPDAAPAIPEQTDALDGPALARATEAGLMRLRVQFAQTLQPVNAGLESYGASVAGRGGESATSDFRDRRDGQAVAVPWSGDPPAAAFSEPRVLRLPPRGVGRDAGSSASDSIVPLGHATLLIRAAGFTVLTDPGFLRRGEPARLGLGQVAIRRADPAIDLDALPPIDVVVLSRLREDHFDRIVQRRLPRDVPIVAPARARAALVALGFSSVHVLPEWGTLSVRRDSGWLRITATPARPGPMLLSALTPTSSGSLLEFGRQEDGVGYRVWITGDTRVDDALLDVWHDRLPAVDLAVLHLGGPGAAGIGRASMDARAGERLLKRLAPRTAIVLAQDDFDDTGPGRSAPASARSMPPAGLSDGATTGIRPLGRGEALHFAPPPRWASVTGAEPALP
jgi:L-ascorbate metabolism protein UlaG (beta-lactamase superfamily)